MKSLKRYKIIIKKGWRNKILQPVKVIKTIIRFKIIL